MHTTTTTNAPRRDGLMRARCAAIGAAVAVSLGAGGFFVAHAVPGPSESTTVNVTPERVLDTRDGNDLGLPGPFVSPVAQKLQVTGPVPTATGTKTVVPPGATGVLLNVTSVSSRANGFISIRPGDATGTATTSSLNITAGITVANAVQVALPTTGANAGKIDVTYDALGAAGPTTDVLIDIAGYTTTTGLQQLIADTRPMFASITPTGELFGGRTSRLVTSARTAVGSYVLTFDRDLAGCVAVGSDLIANLTHDVTAFPAANTVVVRVTNTNNSLTDSFFSVIVQCPQSGTAALVTGGEPSANAD
jgi:hypothetical protein